MMQEPLDKDLFKERDRRLKPKHITLAIFYIGCLVLLLTGWLADFVEYLFF